MIPLHSNRTLEPEPSMVLHPTAINNASISAQAIFDLVGSAKTASKVLRCRLFMLAIYDSKLGSASEICYRYLKRNIFGSI